MGRVRKVKTMKKIWLMLFLSSLPVLLFPDIRNRDKPVNGEWNFRLEKVWEVDKAGGDVFGRPFTLTVAEDERIYLFDPKNGQNYILDKDGALIATFGRSGQGPGELTGQERTFFIDGRLAIIDRIGIQYFSRDGKYVKTSGQERLRRSPQIILGEDEFISFPMTAIGSQEGRAEIYYSRLDTGVERNIGEFSLTQAGRF